MTQIFIYTILKHKGDKPIYSANPEVAQEYATDKEYNIYCKSEEVTGINIYKTQLLKQGKQDSGIRKFP